MNTIVPSPPPSMPVGAALRACAYLRVSTGRQAESDLSIPDQRKQVAAFCVARGWELIAEFVEPGASATDDQRPEFQRMIDAATGGDAPFNLVVVHSYSRFFRDAFSLEMYVRKLARAGVRLVSITQELGDDPSQIMMRQVIALFDEYQSRENGKHVLRAMRENAAQGFYNGSPVPLGYKTAEVERRGARIKKRLVVDEVEAETVRLIFRLYLQGDGEGGPLGVKQVVKWLNSRGHRTRRGASFGVGPVHLMLTNKVYIGEWTFNRRNAKTLKVKPVNEHIVVAVPPIIARDEFDSVQRTLAARNPKVTPSKVVTGPILLSGLAVCADCGAAMIMRTGTSKTGRMYRYYTCGSAARMGKTVCKGRSVPMDKLDTLVVGHLAERLFSTDRLTELLTAVLKRRAQKMAEVDRRYQTLQAEVTQATDRLKRLYRLVEDGVAEMDEILRDRISALRLEKERARAALERLETGPVVANELSPEAIELFGKSMRDNITNGNMAFRRAYLRSVISRIEVGDEVVRVVGDMATLEQAIAGQSRVRAEVLEWRALRDSNS